MGLRGQRTLVGCPAPRCPRVVVSKEASRSGEAPQCSGRDLSAGAFRCHSSRFLGRKGGVYAGGVFPML